MTLSDFAALGSLVSGFAVLVSLVYLSLQVKQTERNQQASIRASRATRITELFMVCTEPSVAEAVSKGSRGAEDISETQLLQFANYSAARFFNAEDSFYQYREGLLNAFSFESVTDGLRASLAAPGMRTMYKGQRGMLGREFVQFVDELLASTPLTVKFRDVAQFKADIAAEKASAPNTVPTTRFLTD